MVGGAIGYIKSWRFVHWALLAVVAIATFTVVYAHISASACYSGNVLGRSCYRGYFSNAEDRGGTSVLPEISGGLAIPHSINTADELYNLLRSAYDSGDKQKRTGAAFIYNTLYAKRAPGGGRSVAGDDIRDGWLKLREDLRGLDAAGKIRWTGNVSATINSYWQGTDEGLGQDGTNNDDAYYSQSKNEAGILIRDYDNNVIYEILRRCANPVGRPSPLPRPQNYTLTPHVDSIAPNEIESGSEVNVTTGVNNIGSVDSKTTQWEITQINVKPDKKAPHEDENETASSTAPCQSNGGAPSGDYFQSGDAACKNAAKGSGSFDLGSPAQNLKPSLLKHDVGDLPVGTRVCFALSVQPRSNTDNQWAHSKPICTTVGKKPKIQIWGGDIAVRGQIETSTSTKVIDGTTKTFGSWVEYGVFSVGRNNNFASASGLSKGNEKAEQRFWSALTFANDRAASNIFGSYTTKAGFRPASGIADYFGAINNKQPIEATSADLGGLTFATTGPVQVRTPKDLTITGGSITKGRSAVIVASGTVTIDGNITYTSDTLNSIQDIPQVVIIAAKIIIKDSVSRVDAWLVADDSINTCYNFTGRLTSGKCGGLLEINGPVVTDSLILNRTAGADDGEKSGDPAERINLRPDAFLWAQLQASGNNKAQTVYSTELPPRF